eukprot:m.41556 g.41556  ORF g.41556 m.41556 type:complete len:828 (+) comp8223_c0_seq2:1578-4061(+)
MPRRAQSARMPSGDRPMSVFRRRSRGPPIADPPATIRRGTSERSGLAPAMLHETSPQSSELRLRISAAREARLGHDQSPAPSSNGSISAAPANVANLGRVSVAEGPAQDRAPPDATETEPIGRIGLHSTGTPSGSGQTLVVRRHPVGSLVTADRVGTVRKARRSVFGRGGGGGGGESATEMHSRLLAVIADRDLLLGFIKEAWKPQSSPLHGLGGSPSVRLDRVAGGGSPPKGGSTTSTAPQPAPSGNLSATVTILSARLDRLRDGTSRGPSDPETFDRRQSKRKGKSAFNLQKEVQALHAEFTMWMEAYEHEQRREASRLERATELERLVAEFMQSLKENEDELARVTERANQLELSVAVLRRELKNKETEARESHDTLKFTQKKLQDLQTSHEFVLTERTAEAMAMHDLQTEVESLRKEREVVRQQAADDAKTLILKHLESGGDSGNAKELSQADDNPLHRDLRQAVARLHNNERGRRASLQMRMRSEEMQRRTLEKRLAKFESSSPSLCGSETSMELPDTVCDQLVNLFREDFEKLEAAWRDEAVQLERMSTDHLKRAIQRISADAENLLVSREASAGPSFQNSSGLARAAEWSSMEAGLLGEFCHERDQLVRTFEATTSRLEITLAGLAAKIREVIDGRTSRRSSVASTQSSCGSGGKVSRPSSTRRSSEHAKSRTPSTRKTSATQRRVSESSNEKMPVLSGPYERLARTQENMRARGGTIKEAESPKWDKAQLKAVLTFGRQEGRVYSAAVTRRKSSPPKGFEKLFLTFKPSDRIEILFVQHPPKGLWLARDSKRHVGFVKTCDFNLPMSTIMSELQNTSCA